MTASYYSDGDGVHKSPPLEAIPFKATPSPSPPPFAISKAHVTTTNDFPDPKRHRRAQPSQADQVLLTFMSFDHPEVARTAATEALNSASQSEEDSPPEDRNGKPRRKPRSHYGQRSEVSPFDLVSVAQKAMAQASSRSSDAMQIQPDMRRTSGPHSPTSPNLTTRPQNNSEIGALVNGVAMVNTSDEYRMSPPWKEERNSPLSPSDTRVHDGERHDSTMSSRLRSLSIPQAMDKYNTLPAFRPPPSPAIGAKSPETKSQLLPGFQKLSEIAEAAVRNKEHEAFHQQRASISSATGETGHSPSSAGRHYSVGSQVSPTSTWFSSISSHTSPSTIQGEFSPRDPFNRGPPMSLHTAIRRPSQASDNNNQSYLLSSSSESFSPSSQASPNDNAQRMSIDGMTRHILPPPHPHGQQQPTNLQSLPMLGIGGGFKCDFPGCTAAPFQTQYLLNSHANVHSQNRPHYCPVEGCARSEGGKGFKRKNEMIRHGLVHDSPGYVCPFCPDREHKYPRPDNLQRHVRVHHIDKDKDDPQLREVLAQRPEGGSRGRRRRVGDRHEFQ